MPLLIIILGLLAIILYAISSSNEGDVPDYTNDFYDENYSPDTTGETVVKTEYNKNMSNEQLASYYAEQKGIDSALVKAIIKTESSWNSNALGTSGEQGLMQLKPQFFGSSGDLFNPETNIKTGVDQLALLLSKYDKETAIQMYNVGETAYKNGKRNTAYLNTVLINEKLYG